jgi:hypothetical protein
MTKITLEIPDELISRLETKQESLQEIFQIFFNALKQHLDSNLESENQNITQTKTWELCGSLEIPNPDTQFIVEDTEAGKSTNYAEHIDQILY